MNETKPRPERGSYPEGPNGTSGKMSVNWSSALDTEDAMTLLHRVVFYGDHLDSTQHLARLMGLRVVEEG